MSETITLLTGHRVRETLAATGFYLVESSPGEDVWLFSHDPVAREIVAEHNRRWKAKHGKAAADAEEAAHARWWESVSAKRELAAAI